MSAWARKRDAVKMVLKNIAASCLRILVGVPIVGLAIGGLLCWAWARRGAGEASD